MNAPRTKNSEETRNRLLEAGRDVMLEKGYVSSTVDGICQAAGLTKGSFFHHFKSKEELGKELLRQFARGQGAAFAEACVGAEDPLDRIYGVVDCATRSARDPEMKGCLIGTVAQEISQTHPELREVCEECFEELARAMTELFVTAKEIHAPDAAFDAASLARYFLAVAQGSMLLVKTTGDREMMAANLTHFRRYLENLFGR